jgi:hypothetical protein
MSVHLCGDMLIEDRGEGPGATPLAKHSGQRSVLNFDDG